MDSLRIDTGEVRLCINDDPSRVIAFNPTDISFAERFYGLLGEFEAKEKEYQEKAKALQRDTSVNEMGIPKNFGASLSLLRETSDFLREKIDTVFGVGTSQAAFGDANTLDMFEQFFTGITPFVQKAREKQVGKYTTKPAKRGALK
ncbi:hypothetical protein [Caproiciproducens faecalis]|uniref:Uncharacterized protein n=1 Tax=Caproiciproducens faecalis TaxID=2820301 RepID=A0ABS7DSC3_9FIRM|nr:hypothetical protein [Caproiciproducens faecalis]MBW7573917.1 hypothetical protein [Caproiciproducens faecalis]